MSPDPPAAPSEQGGASKKVSTKLVALSSAAVFAIYMAGYLKTKAAAERLESAGSGRRPATPDDERKTSVVPAQSAPARPVASDRSLSSMPDRPTSSVTFALPTTPARERAGTTPSPSTPRTAAPVPVPTRGPAGEVSSQAVPAADSVPVPAVSTEPAAVPALTAAAAAAAQAPLAPDAPPSPKAQVAFKDGTYLGWGSCRHGDIQAQVVIAGGRITSATIAQCWTRYSCNWLDAVVPQVVTRQSPNIDYVSGATQSVDAFYWAVVDALAKAK